MALSRLRNPVISRAPSLLRACFLSSAHRSLPRSRVLSSTADAESTLLRTKILTVCGGVHDCSSKLKLQNGARYFSSADSPQQTVIGMPALSPTMSQGNIAKWRKKEGDKIDVGDVLCEIETDKATLEFESLEEGFLAKILVSEGSKDVPVGQPIAITVEDADDIKNVSVSDTAGSGSEVTDKSSLKDKRNEGTEKESSSIKTTMSDLPPHMILGMPALSPTMSQGNIAKWRKQEGDKIVVGDVLCEIETDKATLEFESLEEGFLAKILAPDGAKDIAVGQPIAVTVEDPNDIETVKTSLGGDIIRKEDNVIHHDTTMETKTQKTSFSRISPSAKLLSMEHGLDPSSITPTGPRGTILKGDVLAAIKSGKGSPKVSSSKEKKSPAPPFHSQTPSSVLRSDLQQADAYEDFPNSQIRKVIATRLLESKQSTPHLYLSSDVILDPLLSFRKELKEKFDVKVSVNDIVIKVVAMALRNVPEANAYWDVKKDEVVLCDAVDISIAVATDKGLMTPIVRNADQKSISSISSEVKELAAKARAGKLKPNEFQGGTFSISNLGMFPVDYFCAIINPPQAGILAVGRGNQVVDVVVGPDGNEKPGVVTKMNLTLSADHRVFDGKVAGAFMAALRSNFSDIRRLIL